MNLNAIAEVPGREGVYAAMECLLAAKHALNYASVDGTNHAAYVVFAYQMRATDHTPATPYQLAHEAINEIWRVLAEIDGFRDADVSAIVDRAGDLSLDYMGENDPARRAYDDARDEIIDEAHDFAIDEYMDQVKTN